MFDPAKLMHSVCRKPLHCIPRRRWGTSKDQRRDRTDPVFLQHQTSTRLHRFRSCVEKMRELGGKRQRRRANTARRHIRSPIPSLSTTIKHDQNWGMRRKRRLRCWGPMESEEVRLQEWKEGNGEDESESGESVDLVLRK
ncbi:hypothetical protein BLNAU_9294 [Blattamonas nauphoetae]|uniref:Uncharacterized protein n=1 Tax=Blattamonas nauphoetae TaxID=2049346 RepID=A0ABQ9XWA1_9EUKA|nr:hypothetical protein BLNAU_9294 [Blattamonas nauphoetae]